VGIFVIVIKLKRYRCGY